MDNRSRTGKSRKGSITRRSGLVFLTLICVSILILPAARSSENGIQSPSSSLEVRIAEEPQSTAVDSTTAPPPAFLKSTGILDAWKLLNKDITATIAIVDTGVDFNHPTLKPYLLEGKNLFNDKKPPQDDNGHGTSVAGVIVAIANAGEGNIAKWSGKLLPIKALDKSGSGDEGKLTQGIRYAVDQGADIIVLSLGLRRDAPGLREAVAYAESKGILLVAASGNDAAAYGVRAAVQYPAAYSTVLAVAGSDVLKPVKQSTSGPENDISAAWKVRTLALGGGELESEGTSMGAPQVAAAAAMLIAAHPDWDPLRLREALRMSAVNMEARSWNKQLGYGFLSANKALQAQPFGDWHEPNDIRNQASEFPVGKEVSGSLGTIVDKDWFTFEVPYTGIYTLFGKEMSFELQDANGTRIVPRNKTEDGALRQWTVQKGRYGLRISNTESTSMDIVAYHLNSHFRMSPDAREPNDRAALAVTLPARSQQWSGNFHQKGDEDWFVMTLPRGGSLKLTVSTNTTRIDPEIWVQPAGGTAMTIDEVGDGVKEQWILQAAKAGKYYFRITNAVSSKPDAVIGTYTAALEYITDKEDAFEPNDGPLTSTPLSHDKVYEALLNTNKDEDWYRITLTGKQKVVLSLGRFKESIEFDVELQNRKLQTLKKWDKKKGQHVLFAEMTLDSGTYYVKVKSKHSLPDQAYAIRLKHIDT